MSRSIAIVITNKAEYNLLHYNTQEIGLGKELVRLGCDVDILCYSNTSKPLEDYFVNGVHRLCIYYYTGVRIPGRQTWPINLHHLLTRKRYDIAHLHEYPWIIPAIASRFFKKVETKTILIQGMYRDFEGSLKRSYNRMYDSTFLPVLKKNLDAAIFKTEAARLYLTGKGLGSIPMKVIPVGLDFDHLEEASPPGPIVQDATERISHFARRLLYVGLIEERRNPLFLLRLLERLLGFSKDYVLVVIGEGPLAARVREHIHTRNLEPHIIWFHSIPHTQISHIYRLCDVFLLPSSYEIFGMTLLEALYFNLTIVTTPTAGSAQIIKNDTVGFVRELEIDQWSTIVEKHFSDRHTRQLCNAYVKRDFSWRTLAREYLSVYEELP